MEHSLSEWSRRTELPLNEEKCEILNIVTKKNFTPDPIFTRTGMEVKQVESLSFLRVIFSADLKSNLHFDSITKRAMRRIFIIRNLRKCRCPRSLMKKTYFALIRSILLYAYPCVCNSSSYLQNKFLRVEKRVSRIIGEDMSPALLDVAEESCSRLLSLPSPTIRNIPYDQCSWKEVT